MKLQGSCHCGKVRFSVESKHPYPFNRCYCSICRKVGGGGGYAINIGGEADSLSVTGEEHISVYNAADARAPDGVSPLGRRFCQHCGTMLWAWDARWPELIHPFASAIDTPLEAPPETVHLMLGSKAPWVEPDTHDGDKCFDEYPEESLEAWHQRLGLEK